MDAALQIRLAGVFLSPTRRGVLAPGPQYDAGHFGLAVEADGMLPGQAATDVHERGRLEEGAAVVAAAVAAGHEQRADQRQANLAAVYVTGEHQVDVMVARPADVVWRVAEAQAEGALRTGGQVRRRREPRSFVTDDDERLAAHVELLPAVAEHAQAGAGEAPADHARVVPRVVIAEDAEGGHVPAQPAEHRQDPAMVP